MNMKSTNILKLIEEEENIKYIPVPPNIDEYDLNEYIGMYYKEYMKPILETREIDITDELTYTCCNTMLSIHMGVFDEIDIPDKYYGIIFQANKERKKEFAKIICDYIIENETWEEDE